MKPRILFVDDEKRVLNSMRAMFRREYELFLTTRGDEALRIIAEQPIDVLVADQRMPLMTGVEVLTAAKECSPGTVRILLTGYSDLDAIQGAMNDGEVFRFLNKPCAAQELRGTIGEAARIARDTSQHVSQPGAADTALSDDDVAAALSSAAPAFDVDLLNEPEPEPAPKPARDPKPTTRAKVAQDVPAAEVGTSPPNGQSARESSAPDAQDGEGWDTATASPLELVSAAQAATAAGSSDDAAVPEGLEPVEIVMSGDTVTVVDPPLEPTALAPAPSPDVASDTPPPATTPSGRVRCVGRGRYNISVMVFSPDDQFARSVGRALEGTFYTFHATNAVRLIEAVGRIAPAVLITDVTTDPDVIRNLTSMLKERLPALVTLVAGRHRDADVMIGLINHGQVFRFVDKPMSSTSCHKHVRDALKRHIVIRRNPELAKRYAVRGGSKLSGVLSERIVRGLQRVKQLWGPSR